MKQWTGWIATFVLAIAATAYAQDLKLHTEPNPSNSRATLQKHYVVLVSLDGFRYDYARLHHAPSLTRIAHDGASTPNGMMPSYPSLTFPNHYTLVTGLLPEHHGIVNNTFYAPDLNKSYSYKTNTNDGSFYGGTPLWSLAESQGMRSATLFWVGSEAEIAGHRPTFWAEFNDKYDDHKRIDQVIDWLALPTAERPHFIAVYYSNVDHAAHDHGPDSPEVAAAVVHVDTLIGELRKRLKATHLPVDLVVVSDHGGVKTEGDWITLNELPGIAGVLNGVHRDGSILYSRDDAEAQRITDAFAAHPDPRFTIYRRKYLPAHLHFNENPRAGDPILVPNGPYEFRINTESRHTLAGDHGYDATRMPEMKAIFYATGPDIRHTALKTFPNTDVYAFVAALLGLRPAPNDGTIIPLKSALRTQRNSKR